MFTIIAGIILLTALCWWFYKNKPVAKLNDIYNDVRESSESSINELLSIQRKINEIDMINATILTPELALNNQQERKKLLREIQELEAIHKRLIGPYKEKKEIEEEIENARRRRVMAAAISSSYSSSSSSSSRSSSSSGRSWGGGGGGFSGGGASGGW